MSSADDQRRALVVVSSLMKEAASGMTLDRDKRSIDWRLRRVRKVRTSLLDEEFGALLEIASFSIAYGGWTIFALAEQIREGAGEIALDAIALEGLLQSERLREE